MIPEKKFKRMATKADCGVVSPKKTPIIMEVVGDKGQVIGSLKVGEDKKPPYFQIQEKAVMSE